MNSNDLHNESELFHLVSEGDENAFNQLYLLLLPSLGGFIFKILKSEAAVKEVIQESLVRLWLNRDKLSEISYPKTWFFKIVSNECYRYLRKHGLQQRLAEQVQHHQTAADTNLLHHTEMEVSFRETKRIIFRAVQSLSPRQRTIYKLSREEGLRIPEIAEKLGLSVHYVKKTLMRALHLIRLKLVEAGRFLPVLLIWLLQ